MKTLLLVMAGGAIGAGFRFLVSKAALVTFSGGHPYGTLIVNVAGGLLMGVLVGYLARFADGGENWRLLLGVGVLGGFTTFSAFSLELAQMIQRGAMGGAAVYALVSVVASVVALFAGLAIMRQLTVPA
jgi:fluoride exporter